LPIGHAYALESAGIDPATLLTQAQQHGKRFALADWAMFADWLDPSEDNEWSSLWQITLIAISGAVTHGMQTGWILLKTMSGHLCGRLRLSLFRAQ
jgi:hypothetical protein